MCERADEGGAGGQAPTRRVDWATQAIRGPVLCDFSPNLHQSLQTHQPPYMKGSGTGGPSSRWSDSFALKMLRMAASLR